MNVRDQRASVLRRWHRDLADNFTAVLPRVLDDLDAVDRGQIIEDILSGDFVLSAAQADQLRERLAAAVVTVPAASPADELPAAVRPAPRRRTTRKAAGS